MLNPKPRTSDPTPTAIKGFIGFRVQCLPRMPCSVQSRLRGFRPHRNSVGCTVQDYMKVGFRVLQGSG